MTQTAEHNEALVDLSRLKDSLAGFAKKMVQERGGFFPFARAIEQTGKVAAYGAKLDDQARPPALYELLRKTLRSLAHERKIRACGLCADVTVTSEAGKTSAIRIQLEHVDGVAVETRIKYSKDHDGNYEFEPEEAAVAERVFFKNEYKNE